MPTKLITVRKAAEILCLAEKTVHNRAGGTQKLRRVYQGSAVRLIEVEVLQLLEDRIKKASKPYSE